MTPAQASSLVDGLAAARPFRDLVKELGAGGAPPTLGGVTGALESLLAATLRQATGRPLLVLAAGEKEAQALAWDLEIFGESGEASLFPGGREGAADRARIIARLAEGEGPGVMVAPVRAAMDPLPSPHQLQDARLDLRVGETLERDELVARLADAGLTREVIVDRAGTFSVRGDVVDLFAGDQVLPLRVEFFDEEIEGLRRFDPGTQISVEVVNAVSVNLLLPDREAEGGCLADHLPADVLVLARDTLRLDEARQKHLARLTDDAREVAELAWAALVRGPVLWQSSMKLPPSEGLNLGGQGVVSGGSSFDEAAKTLERVSRGKQQTLVCFESEAERHRFFELLQEAPAGSPAAKALGRALVAVDGRLSDGFHSPLLGVAAVSHHELFAVPTRQRPRRDETPVRSEVIESFLDLEEGDYVVHLGHGIARFEGMERKEKVGAVQEFLSLRFRDDVRLLVPATKIDIVQKYVGGKGEAPQLSKFGSASWSRKKAQVADAVNDVALQLLEMQALRAKKEGVKHPGDTPWQQEFEAAFPYELTNDQARAVKEIKADMESTRPMDRLICGDVGYGKTEVAMRAAFKAVMGGFQVAMLVPTTVLAQQHVQSFRERMADYPVTIEGLFRFRTAREQKEAVEGLATGGVDIVIGTHRLVQGDVQFKNLGLLIIDEEQRFGVTHKERLKEQRKNVDVLTMTATPIPRTLHQALLGIRDISSLNQAPRGRQAVTTEVVPWNGPMIREAILRELDREGQVFFVHNRVQTLAKTAKKLEELVPEARYLQAHGQMPERSLERTMLAFLDRKADVLVATTIIESGLDIPSVNTIFVDQTDLYGLADLHQLRGRVGRYHHKAYAYFMVRPDRVVSEIAEKRLRAIEEFSRLGAGFQIAMRDMEIRGAGNILGAEQSGHIAAVGYEMYCRLLDVAVRRLNDEEVALPEELEINLDFTAFIPESYLSARRLRIEIYRKLGRCITEVDFAAVISEIRDRFGPPPREVEELVLVARIRALMERLRLRRLEMMTGEGLALRPRRMRSLVDRLRVPPDEVRVLGGKTVLLVHPDPFEGPAALLAFLERSLGEGAES